MKQVLVKKHEKLTDESFTEFSLRAEKAMVIMPGANWVELNWPLSLLSGGDLRFFFTVDASLATAGVSLSAHYMDKTKPGSVFLVLHNHNQHSVNLTENAAIASAHAYEPVQVRQVDQDFKEVIMIEKPKKRTPRRAKPQKPEVPPQSDSSS